MFYGTEALRWHLTATNHNLSRDAARRFELASAIRRQRAARRDRTRTARRRELVVAGAADPKAMP